MSQQHIPQPDAVAPGEQVSSVDTAAPMTSIETTSPSPSQDIFPAVGEFNALDPYFYNQDRRLVTIPWSTSDETGKMLWYIPLNPLQMDENLAYFCKAYLAWVGDFVFMFKIAGTGFHAGMLTFVKLPPTVHPTKVQDPKLYSYFPWDGADPKLLQCGGLYGRDIRPIKYHYMRKQANLPEDYYMGGYLACFVDLPLATSATGNPTINVAVWIKCAPSFRVSWMLPVKLQQDLPSVMAPPVLSWMLSFRQHNPKFILSSAPITMEKVIVFPAATKVLNNGIYNCSKLNGDGMSQFDEVALENVGFHNVYGQTDDTFVFKGIVNPPRWQYVMETPGVGYYIFDGQPSGDQCATFEKWTLGASVKGQLVGQPRDASKKQDLGFYTVRFANTGEGRMPDGADGNEYAPPVSGEAFVLFGGSRVTSAQHCGLSRYFRSRALQNWMPPGMCALFQVYEVDEDLPIFYAKLYSEGYFTAPAREDEQVYVADKLEFRFEGFVSRTSMIPKAKGQVATNRMLVHHLHKAIFRNKARAEKAQKKAASKKSSASQMHYNGICSSSTLVSRSSDRKHSDPWCVPGSSRNSVFDSPENQSD